MPAAVFSAVPEQHHVTDQFTGLGHLDAEGQRLALIGERGVRPLRGELFVDDRAGHRLEGYVAADVRPTSVGEQRIDVAGRPTHRRIMQMRRATAERH
jgi:hypothetical protein